jgi:hypothetical protein
MSVNWDIQKTATKHISLVANKYQTPPPKKTSKTKLIFEEIINSSSDQQLTIECQIYGSTEIKNM